MTWGGGAPELPSSAAGRRGLHLDAATAFSFVVAALFARALWQSRAFGPCAGLPWAIGFPMLALALVQLGRDLAGRRGGAAPDAVEGASDLPPRVIALRSLEICAWIVGAFAPIWLLGFTVSALVTTFVYLRSAGEGWTLSVVLSLGAFAFVYGLFERMLAVLFPPGHLLVWLGFVS